MRVRSGRRERPVGLGVSRVAVVGAGIAGLSAARRLHRSGHEVVVYEAADRAGGKLHTVELAGHRIDVGADAFLARQPGATELAEELRLDVVAPVRGDAALWTRGRLRPLPAGTVLGAPTEIVPVLRSGVLSPRGVLRAVVDLVRAASPLEGDASVGEVVGRRFGDEVVDTLVDPLLGGVYAGDARRLSVRAATPMLADAAERDRSLLLGLRRWRAGLPEDDRPVFGTVPTGLASLAAAVVAELPEGTVRTSSAAWSLRPTGRAWEVGAGEEVTQHDGVVLALPAHAAAPLLAEAAPVVARSIEAIPYADVAVVALAFPRVHLPDGPSGSGVLVPRGEGRFVKAATWSSAKWAHLDDPDSVLLRASIGRVGDDGWQTLEDDELVRRVWDDIGEALELPEAAEPTGAVVQRWPRGLPQYEVGHLELVATARAALPPGLALAGAAYDGVGVPACIRSGTAAADLVTR